MLFDMLFQAAFLICALQNHNFTTSNTIRMKTISSSKMWGFFTEKKILFDMIVVSFAWFFLLLN